MSKCDTSKDKFLTQCLDAKIQALKPENANPDVWIPTFDQLQDLICQNVKKKSDDIWKVNEGKNPFEKEKKEEKSSKKTLTGKKPTAVEIEPKVE